MTLDIFSIPLPKKSRVFAHKIIVLTFTLILFEDEILLEFINSTTRDQSADLARDINSYVANEVCTVTGASEVDYPTLDIPR